MSIILLEYFCIFGGTNRPEYRDRKREEVPTTYNLGDKQVEVVARAVNIIEKIAFSENIVSIRDLAKETGYSKSSIHRIIKTLMEKGFISKTWNDSYTLGPKFLLLKSVTNVYENYVEIVSPLAQEIVDATEQTVLMNVLNGEKGLCIFTLEPRSAVKYVAEVGMTIPLQGGASGKVLLAFAPEEVRERILESPLISFTSNTVTDKNILRMQIDEIRREKIAVSREEFQENSFAVSVPIFSPSGHFLSQYGIAGAVAVLDENEEFFVNEVRKSAKKVEEKLSTLWKVDC